jgi:hypothetical protein
MNDNDVRLLRRCVELAKEAHCLQMATGASCVKTVIAWPGAIARSIQSLRSHAGPRTT